MRMLIIAATIALMALGCASLPVKVPHVTGTNYEVLGEGEASATGVMLLTFIPIKYNDRFDRAYKAAIASKGGDELIDPVISDRWFWAYVLNGYITHVKGTVIKYKK